MKRLPTAPAEIVNLSRRGLLAGTGTTALVLGFGPKRAAAQAAAANVPASAKASHVADFLHLGADGRLVLLSPFAEMGQGIYTALAQIVGEELDLDPSAITVEQAPHGPQWRIQYYDNVRFTGGSFSVRSSYATFRTIGATARAMLLQAAAAKLGVPVSQLSTLNGRVLHGATGADLTYASLAADAAKLPAPEKVALRNPDNFRYIGKPVKRNDVRAKSTGRAMFGIDTRLAGMRYAAVLHSPGYAEVASLNDAKARVLRGVYGVHRLPGAVAVVADSFWRAKQALAAVEVTWGAPKLAKDFSSQGQLATMQAAFSKGETAEQQGPQEFAAIKTSVKIFTRDYDAPYIAHATMEPQNATARFNADGTLEVWIGNQGPDFFADVAAGAAGIAVEKVVIHTPYVGGGFGRRFTYGMEVLTEAVLLTKAEGAPVKVVWHREEDFSRDHFRPLSTARFSTVLGEDGMPRLLFVSVVGEGPMARHTPQYLTNPAIDDSVVEGLTEKPYAIASRRVGYTKVLHPANIGYWRSVGHSVNAFFYESFLDEMALVAKQDPLAYRLALLKDSPRHTALLTAVVELAGGWKSGPYAVGGQRRAMGVAMDAPFGSEVAVIAEVSAKGGEVTCHRVWLAIDPGSIVNPAIIERQMHSGVAMGVSQTLLEQVVFRDGWFEQSNFDSYPILGPDRMPEVHVRIVESGFPMGGIGEAGTPAVAPAIANAVAVLTGQRVRSLPLSKTKIGQA